MTIDTETLTTISLAHLATDPASLRISPVKTGKHNASFWVECDAGRFVLRIAPPDDAGFLFYEQLMMHQEPQLHDIIRANTTIPVAEVVGYDFSRRQIDRDYILLAALPGQPLSELSGLTGTQFNRTLYQVGEHLRELHKLTATACLERETAPYGYIGAHQPMAPQDNWGAAFEIMWHKLLDDVVASGGYNHDEGQAMRDLLELHRHHFDHPVTARLLHMDIWSENILIDADGNVTGLVDFDRALWGDVEIEYAVLDYCGISEPPFWQGYGSRRDQSTPALIRRQFYLLYEIQKYIPIYIWRRSDPTTADQYKQRSFQLAAQLLPKS
ncbi:MAG: aminoglycoside phosphotransferase family protein [Anaerolineae bacterium]|nr:aminoglycoside phosphotransferase family protein [Anaerolineae bacterium]